MELYESVIKPYTADRGITWEVQIAEEDVSRKPFYIEGLLLRVMYYSPSSGGSAV